MATVQNIFVFARSRGPALPVAESRAVEGRGLEGDRPRRDHRQVLLVGAESLEDLGLLPGEIRENVVIRGLPLEALPAGTRLRAGEAELEITEPCSPCARMDEVRPGLRVAILGRRGVLARVVRGGSLRVGDPVSRIPGGTG